MEKLREETTRREVLVKENAEELQTVISEKRNLELQLAVIAEKHRVAQQEVCLLTPLNLLLQNYTVVITTLFIIQVSSRDRVILQLRAELRVLVEKNQGVQEEVSKRGSKFGL